MTRPVHRSVRAPIDGGSARRARRLTHKLRAFGAAQAPLAPVPSMAQAAERRAWPILGQAGVGDTRDSHLSSAAGPYGPIEVRSNHGERPLLNLGGPRSIALKPWARTAARLVQSKSGQTRDPAQTAGT